MEPLMTIKHFSVEGLVESNASALIIKNWTHPQTIVNVDNVTAQDSWLQLWHTKHSPLPHVTHARDDVVSPDRSELLVKLFGAAVCQVNVLGNDGGFRNDDPRAGVLELSINAYVFSFTVTLPAYVSGHGNTAVGNKHAGDSLLFCSGNWDLRGSRKGWITISCFNNPFHRNVCELSGLNHHELLGVDVNGFLHLEISLAFCILMAWFLYDGLHVVSDWAKLPYIGGNKAPVWEG